jgi:hypothetical protein
MSGSSANNLLGEIVGGFSAASYAASRVAERASRARGVTTSTKQAVAATALMAVMSISACAGNSAPSKNMALSSSNGRGYCQEIIGDRMGGSPEFAIDGEIFDPNDGSGLYKVTLRAQTSSKLQRWQCRLRWQGGAWTIDALEKSSNLMK